MRTTKSLLSKLFGRKSKALKPGDVDVYLEDATAYTVEHLGSLLDRQILGASRFMDLVRKAQDEASQDPGAYTTPL